MAVTVLWSDQAEITFANNIAYLKEAWNENELKKFILRAEYVVLALEANPELYAISGKSKKIRKAVVNKRITLYYKYYPRKKVVVLLSFWNTHQDVHKLKFR